MRTEIPAFPVLVPLAVVAFVALALRLRRSGAVTPARVGLAAVVCVYGVGLLRSVLLPFPVVLGAARDALPPWTVFVQLVPVVTSLDDPIGIVLNVALFVPLGVLVPLLVRTGSGVRVLLLALAISLAIEVVQLVADVTVSTGRVADVDDLLGNALGAVVGYGLFRAALRVEPLARMARAARWPRPASRAGAPVSERAR